jgi:hypothetical protein
MRTGWRTVGNICTRVWAEVEARIDRLAGLRRIGIVKSARGAVPVFRPARFPGPLPAPGVPVSGHRALHKPCHGLP